MKNSLFGLVFIICSSAYSQAPSDNQVLKIARTLIDDVFPERGYEVDSVFPVRDENITTMYLLNLIPEGWIIISADLRVKPVIGFSFTGIYSTYMHDQENPQNLWLNNYNREIKFILSQKQDSVNPDWDTGKNLLIKDKSLKTGIFIENLIPATWGQEDSWNQFCPADQDGPGGHVYLGCVAVSMAQAMSAFSWPFSGYGSNSYFAEGYGIQSADFGNTEYKWDSVSYESPDKYNSLLLYHCAVSVNMDFGADGSSALLTDATTALRSNFIFSRRIRLRDRVTDDVEWMAILNQQLIAGRPIIYSGDSDDGSPGHAFNIDGVINSYYHINWGWSGTNDGYYTINSLKPGSYDFTKNQSAILGIQPYYFPTGISLSDTIVPLDALPGFNVGTVSVIDEAADNSYKIIMVSDSTRDDMTWVKDYFLDGYSLRTGRVFTEADEPYDTVLFTVTDKFNRSISQNVILRIGTNSNNIGSTHSAGNNGLRVFPNPAENLIYFETAAGKIIEEVLIYSLSGTLLMEEKIGASNGMISVNGLNKGIYMLGARFWRGKMIWKEFIKK